MGAADLGRMLIFGPLVYISLALMVGSAETGLAAYRLHFNLAIGACGLAAGCFLTLRSAIQRRRRRRAA